MAAPRSEVVASPASPHSLRLYGTALELASQRWRAEVIVWRGSCISNGVFDANAFDNSMTELLEALFRGRQPIDEAVVLLSVLLREPGASHQLLQPIPSRLKRDAPSVLLLLASAIQARNTHIAQIIFDNWIVEGSPNTFSPEQVLLAIACGLDESFAPGRAAQDAFRPGSARTIIRRSFPDAAPVGRRFADIQPMQQVPADDAPILVSATQEFATLIQQMLATVINRMQRSAEQTEHALIRRILGRLVHLGCTYGLLRVLEVLQPPPDLVLGLLRVMVCLGLGGVERGAPERVRRRTRRPVEQLGAMASNQPMFQTSVTYAGDQMHRHSAIDRPTFADIRACLQINHSLAILFEYGTRWSPDFRLYEDRAGVGPDPENPTVWIDLLDPVHDPILLDALGDVLANTHEIASAALLSQLLSNLLHRLQGEPETATEALQRLHERLKNVQPDWTLRRLLGADRIARILASAIQNDNHVIQSIPALGPSARDAHGKQFQPVLWFEPREVNDAILDVLRLTGRIDSPRSTQLFAWFMKHGGLHLNLDPEVANYLSPAIHMDGLLRHGVCRSLLARCLPFAKHILAPIIYEAINQGDSTSHFPPVLATIVAEYAQGEVKRPLDAEAVGGVVHASINQAASRPIAMDLVRHIMGFARDDDMSSDDEERKEGDDGIQPMDLGGL